MQDGVAGSRLHDLQLPIDRPRERATVLRWPGGYLRVYFPVTRSVYLVPIGAVADFKGRLRLEPALNNQKRGVRFAEDFEIDRWSKESLRQVVAGASLMAA
jgi:hypothetical protein